jgi:hypothetical protein
LLPALVVAARRGELNLGALVRALVRARRVMFAYAGRDDTRPLTAMLGGKLREIARLLVRRRATAARGS